MATSTAEAPADTTDVKAQVSRLVAEGKKAIALKQWDAGVTKYADALDVQRQLVGDFDPTMAPLLLSYGRALYELALSQQGVMGKEEVAKGTDPATQLDRDAEAAGAEAGAGGKFVFEDEGEGEDEDGDGDDDEEDGANGDGGEGAGGEADGDEPEDDFNAAWDVLDVARTIYAREIADLPSGPEAEAQRRSLRLLLSECYLSLADVSCETENFDQAVQDYTSALEIKSELLPASSRALASAHYQLGTVLEFTPGGRSEALKHVQSALDGFKLRARELEASETAKEGSAAADSNGEEASKSEAAPTTQDNDDIRALSPRERALEAKDVAALIGDLEVKIEELRAAPEAGDIVAQSISHLLGGGSAAGAFQAAFGSVGGAGTGSASASGSGSGSGAAATSGAAVGDAPVNDLTSMVRKKRRNPPAPATGEKRKAEDEADGAGARAKGKGREA